MSDHLQAASDEVRAATRHVLRCLDQEEAKKSPRLRYVGINALGQLGNGHFDVLPTEFGGAVLAQLLLSLRGDQHVKVQCHACAALINFVPHCEGALLEQQGRLDALMRAVMGVLKTGNEAWQRAQSEAAKKNWAKLQEQALTALAALAQKAARCGCLAPTTTRWSPC